jgi:hypothetical protein
MPPPRPQPARSVDDVDPAELGSMIMEAQLAVARLEKG